MLKVMQCQNANIQIISRPIRKLDETDRTAGPKECCGDLEVGGGGSQLSVRCREMPAAVFSYQYQSLTFIITSFGKMSSAV